MKYLHFHKGFQHVVLVSRSGRRCCEFSANERFLTKLKRHVPLCFTGQEIKNHIDLENKVFQAFIFLNTNDHYLIYVLFFFDFLLHILGQGTVKFHDAVGFVALGFPEETHKGNIYHALA